MSLTDFPRSLFDNKPDDAPNDSNTQMQQTQNAQVSNTLLLQAALAGQQQTQQLNVVSPPLTQPSSSASVSYPTLVTTLYNHNRSQNLNPNQIQSDQAHTKKCMFHSRQLVRPVHPQQHQQMLQHHQQQQQQIRLNNQVVTMAPNNPTNQNSPNSQRSAQRVRDAFNMNTVLPLNAALLQDRYLLLDAVDGSSFHKSMDILTRKMLVCKVSRFN